MLLAARFFQLAKETHRSFRDLDITIENPKGSIRRGKSKEGKEWEQEMKCDYGYIPDTEAAGDKEDVDVYVGEDESSDKVFVVEQLKDDGSFDEYKLLLGFPDFESARAMYLAHYPEDWEEKNVGEISEAPISELFSAVERHQNAV